MLAVPSKIAVVYFSVADHIWNITRCSKGGKWVIFFKHRACTDMNNSQATWHMNSCYPRGFFWAMWKILNSIVLVRTNRRTLQLYQTFMNADEFNSHITPALNVSSLKQEVLFFPKAVPHFIIHTVWDMGRKTFSKSSSLTIISPLLMKPFSNVFMPGYQD